ncbi:protein THEM6 [Neodiprion pinetum]|uniref:Protein THEM6 n=1 Tax=Neodiprion lecontei TaxID=441921 RepID=A0A6J0C4E5_NEOLC|nr:protein THEM6 [Neodiprion lecontei]XP_015521407.1 protein THEM6 [Neodiprion lecontei]XP_015521408.1 protein THEM6 [Neodiprion lecontei]XP_046421121.1 protein THEM6 [Neodiprion fabricii]XP_046421122.1 protein THEM6 [Neodiprion fabricii]XP_046421123.1 protein THEM6 [Neodiprion fabricii]XP_046421124.1 protein THEM6 [Neodiprion fabricii]XP_046421125.1 protein THEM6 [Neodiprion fabricii]XP_046421126.1 protein THEM6 [Neodiprion fabricii]XP_046476964.1 protein THEM6 [Neodiprion pinetum]XP_046
MIACCVLAGVLGVVVLFYVFLEVHYFLRMCLTVLLARFCKKQVHILDETSVYGVCITTDIDTLLYHMNNARYLRELDFARVDFYERTNLYREIRAQGSGVVQGAATIRYRRFLRPFSVYKITSKIIYWDDKSIFMEHKFISSGDGFVRAIAICRQRVLECSAEAVMGVLLDRGGKVNGGLEAGIAPTSAPHVRPEIPPEVALWLESNEISSASLRPTPEPPRC